MHRLKTLYKWICSFIVVWLMAHSLITSAASASSISYIRDTEIENAIRYYCQPIFEVAGLDAASVNIHIINDKRLNAFVAQGQQIFINTGTIAAAEKPEEVIGVLAHETGHITGGHLSQLYANYERAQDINIAAAVLGIPLAILSGQPEVAIAALGLGSQVATRGFLKYTRANEEAADQAALTFLDAAGITSEGMLTFLNKIHKQSQIYSDAQNPYSQTHPLTQSRVNFVEHHTQRSSYTGKKMSEEFYRIHDRIRAKIIGYVDGLETVNKVYPESDNSIPAQYARAIAHKENGNYDLSLEIVRSLQAQVPEDPFFIELEGDILLDAARIEESIEAYDRALAIIPWAALIHQNAGRARIETQDPELLPAALKNLKTAARLEPNVSSNWRLLATVYGRMGDQANTALALAEEALLRNRLPNAVTQSNKALDLLPRGSAGWLRAEDINLRAKDLQKDKKS
ncbi:M48 family metalloprotease [Curvivirga sp.]|uniref:M48 family metallopeptidase n=1 Tax=Curvivirga sp. TaxID=2856848 RepID=UPI003B5A2F48